MPETSILTNGGFSTRIKFFMVEFLKSIYITKPVRKRFTRKQKKLWPLDHNLSCILQLTLVTPKTKFGQNILRTDSLE